MVFKKTKHNPKVLRDTTKVIAEYVVDIVEKDRAASVGYNSSDEVIEIEAKLTGEHIVDLNNKFGGEPSKNNT